MTQEYAALECDGMTVDEILAWCYDIWYARVNDALIGWLLEGKPLPQRS
jgi:hypothetical protein